MKKPFHFKRKVLLIHETRKAILECGHSQRIYAFNKVQNPRTMFCEKCEKDFGANEKALTLSAASEQIPEDRDGNQGN